MVAGDEPLRPGCVHKRGTCSSPIVISWITEQFCAFCANKKRAPSLLCISSQHPGSWDLLPTPLLLDTAGSTWYHTGCVWQLWRSLWPAPTPPWPSAPTPAGSCWAWCLPPCRSAGLLCPAVTHLLQQLTDLAYLLHSACQAVQSAVFAAAAGALPKHVALPVPIESWALSLYVWCRAAWGRLPALRSPPSTAARRR